MGAYSTDVLLDALVLAITAAWNPPKIIEDTEPPAYDGVRTLDYVVLSPGDVTCSLGGPGASVSLQWERNPFTITYRFKLPDNAALKAMRVKTQKAQELRGQLQAAEMFAGIGYFPLITRVRFARLGPPDEGAAEVVVEFECWTQSTHH
jgi:hypothetical protein